MLDEIINVLKSDDDINYNIFVNTNKSDSSDELTYKMINNMFSNQNITVNIGYDEDNKIIIYKDDERISKSTMKELSDSILYTNSDQYKTQRNQLKNLTFPDSILSLQNKVFKLKGYPKANNEKLILIAISRYIEQLSYKNGGSHYSTFQRLSRINDERGTKDVYNKLSENVDKLHVYGQKNENLELNDKFIIHSGKSDAYKYTWIVIHLSENSCAALVAIENKNKHNEWNAIWTFDRYKVVELKNKMNYYF